MQHLHTISTLSTDLRSRSRTQFPSSIKVKPSLKLIQVCIQTNSEVALPFSLPAFTFQKVVADGFIVYYYAFSLHHNYRKLLNTKDDVTKTLWLNLPFLASCTPVGVGIRLF